MSSRVNVFDFDHTIYHGDASMDFITFVVLRDIRFWRYLPAMMWALMLYLFGFRTRKEIKQVAFRFLQQVDNLDERLELFWTKNEKKIKQWYRDMSKNSDIIISASPEFLLRPIAKRLQINTLIGTRMDKKTGLIEGKNCRGREKVRRLTQEFAEIKIGAVYSDSLSDVPILELGEGYIVKKDEHIPYITYVPSKIKQFKTLAFLRFLLVGGVNALLGVSFAYVASLFIMSPQIAFVLGFAVSLIPSYFLNSIITFRDYIFSARKFTRFIVSYIPNFLIQLFIVHGVTEAFNLYPLFTYITSVVIAVPVTFLLLRKLTFKEGENHEKR